MGAAMRRWARDHEEAVGGGENASLWQSVRLLARGHGHLWLSRGGSSVPWLVIQPRTCHTRGRVLWGSELARGWMRFGQ